MDGAETFDAWRDGFAVRAHAAGLSTGALEGLEPDPEVLRRDRHQPETSLAVWDYLDRAVSQARIDAGQAALRQHRAVFEAVAQRYPVPPQILAAIWGMESAYGTIMGDLPVLRSLATLSHDGRRRALFEAQLLDALHIVDSGAMSAQAMRGSWAGAMGHVQFMPSAYLAHAVAFSHAGPADIWGPNPADALASAAAYLIAHGWIAGQTWGREVALPNGFDLGTADGTPRDADEWAHLGVRLLQEQAPHEDGPAALHLPAGAGGPVFLTSANFQVLKRYNASGAYALAVGHLSDRLAGGPPVAAAWPRHLRALTRAERQEIQERLTAAGYPTHGADGLLGPNSQAALRAWQRDAGVPVDGFATVDVLARLR